jgi:ketosteroid isomerase-like protein
VHFDNIESRVVIAKEDREDGLMLTKDDIADFITAIFANDVAALSPKMTEHVIWRTPRSALPTHQSKHGRQATLAMLAGGLNSPYLRGTKHVEIQFILVDGKAGAARYQMQAQLKSGGCYANQYCLFFRCEDGKIAELWEHVDSSEFYSLLGSEPTWLRDIGNTSADSYDYIESSLSACPSAKLAVDFINRCYESCDYGVGEMTPDNVVWHAPSSTLSNSESDGQGNSTYGMAANRDIARLIPGTALPTIELSVGSGDLAAVQFRLKAQCQNGRHYENRYAWFFRCHDGQIAEVWELLDTAAWSYLTKDKSAGPTWTSTERDDAGQHKAH